MDTLEAALNVMRPGCFMASVDLKDAYYTVPIHPSHQEYLKFCFDGVFYKYTRLPNGLASAPCIFTQLLKPVYATLRSMGDSYLQRDTFAECHKNDIDTNTLFTKLGFHIHPEFVLGSIAMIVALTEEKVKRILSVCATLLQTHMFMVAQAIVNLVSNFPVAQYGPLHYHHLERDKYLALIANKAVYGGECNYHLPLLQNFSGSVIMRTPKRDIPHDHPSTSIQLDASTLGWGAVFGTQKTGGGMDPFRS